MNIEELRQLLVAIFSIAAGIYGSITLMRTITRIERILALILVMTSWITISVVH